MYINASKYIFFMYYIKNAPETLPLPEIFENLGFPLPLLLPLRAPNSLGAQDNHMSCVNLIALLRGLLREVVVDNLGRLLKAVGVASLGGLLRVVV
jgi:hypothetical protein